MPGEPALLLELPVLQIGLNRGMVCGIGTGVTDIGSRVELNQVTKMLAPPLADYLLFRLLLEHFTLYFFQYAELNNLLIPKGHVAVKPKLPLLIGFTRTHAGIVAVQAIPRQVLSSSFWLPTQSGVQ